MIGSSSTGRPGAELGNIYNTLLSRQTFRFARHPSKAGESHGKRMQWGIHSNGSTLARRPKARGSQRLDGMSRLFPTRGAEAAVSGMSGEAPWSVERGSVGGAWISPLRGWHSRFRISTGSRSSTLCCKGLPEHFDTNHLANQVCGIKTNAAVIRRPASVPLRSTEHGVLVLDCSPPCPPNVARLLWVEGRCVPGEGVRPTMSLKAGVCVPHHFCKRSRDPGVQLFCPFASSLVAPCPRNSSDHCKPSTPQR